MEPVHAADDHVFTEDGRRGCGPGCQLVTETCSCGLSRRLRILDGTIRGIELRPRSGWQWHDVRELLAMSLPYALCSICTGDGCDRCRGLGILERVPRHSGVAG